MMGLIVLERYVLRNIIHFFQERALPGLMNRYEALLKYILVRKRPVYLLIGLFILFPISLLLLILRDNPKPFFPSGDPKFVYVYLKMPIGTKSQTTDSVLRILEGRVYKVLGTEQPGKEGSIVESVISNVAVGANNPRDNNRSTQSHLGRIQISFVEFEQRHGKSSAPIQEEIRKQMKGIPGGSIEVRQEDAGPPTEPPVNIEVAGDNFDALAKTAIQLQNHLDTNRIAGMQNLEMDVDLNNPEITVNIDRQRALAEGVSTAQIGMELRTAVFGKEVSKLKDDEDEYKIQLRLNTKSRNDINELMNMRIVFRDFTSGAIKQIPINSVATLEYTNTAGGVKRKNLKRTIQIQSAVTDPSLTPEI
ncbi:MAG: copper transporter, partial [Sphingobacteriia bacterium 32-37-4]